MTLSLIDLMHDGDGIAPVASLRYRRRGSQHSRYSYCLAPMHDALLPASLEDAATRHYAAISRC